MWRWRFLWCREILPREEGALEGFQLFLQQACLAEGRLDRWVWNASDEGVYTVKCSSTILQETETELEEPNQHFTLLCQQAAPSNVLAFGWRLL